MNFDTDFDDMSDEELIDAAGSLRDENAELRQTVQHLTQKLARAYYRENENTSEIARHHAHFEIVSVKAEQAHDWLRNFEGTDTNMVVGSVTTAVREIRNIVG